VVCGDASVWREVGFLSVLVGKGSFVSISVFCRVFSVAGQQHPNITRPTQNVFSMSTCRNPQN